MTQYKTLAQIKKVFNTTKVVQVGNLLQVQHFQTKLFHYLVENCSGWSELGITSKYPEFFTQISKGE